MSIRKIKAPNLNAPTRTYNFEPAPAVMARFNDGLRLEADAAEAVIPILGVIGADMWGDGVSPRRVQQQLNEFGKRPVTVHLNSPGGQFFDGLAIFNMLRLHPGEVTVKILGIAASAASVVAMAGDKIQVPKSGWMMIHNTQAIALGDRHVFAEMVEDLKKFDGVLAGIYADRTGMDTKKVAAMLDAETFISGEEAVDQGFADSILEGEKIETDQKTGATNALRELESILTARAMPRAERRDFLKRLFASKPSAAGEDGDTPGAVSLGELKGPLEALRLATAGFEEMATSLKG